MCSRHADAGADSPESYVLKPYKVEVCDRYDPDMKWTVYVPKALGPNDARNQAKELHPNASPLREWEAQ